MVEQESVETRLARIEEQLRSIHDTIKRQTTLRHVNRDGVCDVYAMALEHDRRLSQWAPDVEKIDEHEKQIRQWTGAMSLASAVSAFIGALIAIIITKVWK
jgi:hypothetical protein